MRLEQKPHCLPIAQRRGWRAGNQVFPTRMSPTWKSLWKYGRSLAIMLRAASLRLYTTVRPFPATPSDALELELKFVDVPSIAGFDDQVGAGPVPIPSGARYSHQPHRNLRAARRYYGSEEIRRGIAPFMLNVRRESVSEPDLLAKDIPARQIRAMFFQPDALEDAALDATMRSAGLRHEAPADLVGRLSQEIGLDATGLTLFARKGRRTVIGCSRNFGHVLAPDRSAIFFSDKGTLARRWVVVLQVEIARDWTWDALTPVSFQCRVK
jgi:hypothetical protein